MRDVRVVAGILDDPGHGLAAAQFGRGEREGDALAAGQRDLDRIGKNAGQERGAGCLRARGGAGAGRPASLQGAVLVASADL